MTRKDLLRFQLVLYCALAVFIASMPFWSSMKTDNLTLAAMVVLPGYFLYRAYAIFQRLKEA
ncbi:MAG: hypothetical protein IPL65_13335 [Lewinellaceae bacterium]|nr:hypothetical protein [Lewinellaceae bacterium]